MIRLLVFAVVAPLALACGGAGGGNRQKLLEAARGYNDALRWQNYGGAAHWLPARRRTAFLDAHANGGDRIMEYRIREIRMKGEPGEQATVIVVSSWVRPADPTVQTSTTYQIWRYLGREGWRMVAETDSDPSGSPPGP